MTAQAILKQHFGYSDFRSGQETLIQDILEGRDVLGIMPTGAGKSICFQVPALMMDGITLIISPLISLMKDQVSALCQSGIRAAFINSSLSPKQVDMALRNACAGMYKLIYAAPERLLSYDFLQFAQNAKIPMLTVDESHCISQWGHDFRPSYARIPEFIDRLPERPVISAFTATATPKVTSDIINLLRLNDPAVLKTGFDRPNLRFEVIQAPLRDKTIELLDFLKTRQEQSGIVYCNARKTVEEVCDTLKSSGYNASRYHAGLSDKERHDNQDDFLFDRVQIMVATNAFGMGIDKSNVSYVVHYNMPKDMEGYYQEAGRAGRDGTPAECLLLYSGQDVRTNTWLIENSRENDSVNNTETIKRSKERLKWMTFYSTTSDCLRGYILKYFGERPPANCGSCSNCDGTIRTKPTKEKPKAVPKPERGTTPVNMRLFAALRNVRRGIAEEQKVPAFVIFHDSVLMEMSAKFPSTREELLDVSGVGQIKADRYGVRFLEAIAGFTDIGKSEEPLPKFDPTAVEITDEPVTVSTVADRINCGLIASGHPKISGIRINNWLVSQGVMNIITVDEKNVKVPTPRGEELGITSEERIIRGEPARQNLYGRLAQEYIAGSALDILGG